MSDGAVKRCAGGLLVGAFNDLGGRQQRSHERRFEQERREREDRHCFAADRRKLYADFLGTADRYLRLRTKPDDPLWKDRATIETTVAEAERLLDEIGPVAP